MENYNNDKERIISDGNIGEDGQENESGKFASLVVLLCLWLLAHNSIFKIKINNKMSLNFDVTNFRKS